MGILEDGRPYVVYRAMIFCDDFQQSSLLYSANSASGVYLLPMGLSHEARKSRTAVHIISLTPPGVSTNEVLRDIIPDIVKGSTTGVEGVTPDGQTVVIFLDILGYIADYPASSAALDLTGHTGDSPCTHCNFRKVKDGSHSAVGYSTEIHSMNTAALRCGERNVAVRNADLPDWDANMLGMKPKSSVTDRRCPLIALQMELAAARLNVPLTIHGRPPAPEMFDAYRSNVAAPDHLFTGLIRNVVSLFFQTVTPNERLRADVAICTALESNGLSRERSVYNEREGQLHSMSLTSLYGILLAANPVLSSFRKANDDITDEVFELIQHLQYLVKKTMRSRPVSGDTWNGHSASPYIQELQNIATGYVSKVNEFCGKHKKKGAILDNPNLHRLLELFHHTIPALGHVSHVFELVFEAAHQPLKRCITRGNHHEAEVSAVEHCIGNDWQSRVALLQHLKEDGDDEEKTKARHGLRRLLIGDIIDKISITDEKGQKLLSHLDSRIEMLFDNVVKHILKANGNVGTALGSQYTRWVLQGKQNMGPYSDSNNAVSSPTEVTWDVQGLIERGRRIIEMQKGHFGDRKRRISFMPKAKRVKVSAVTQWATSNSWETLESEMVIEAPIPLEDWNNTILRPQNCSRSRKSIFVVIGFLDSASHGPWVVCVPVHRENGGIVRTPIEVHAAKGRVVQLNDEVRRVAVYYMCGRTTSCIVDVENRTIMHGERIFSGETFRTQSPSDGYPPRMA